MFISGHAGDECSVQDTHIIERAFALRSMGQAGKKTFGGGGRIQEATQSLILMVETPTLTLRFSLSLCSRSPRSGALLLSSHGPYAHPRTFSTLATHFGFQMMSGVGIPEHVNVTKITIPVVWINQGGCCALLTHRRCLSPDVAVETRARSISDSYAMAGRGSLWSSYDSRAWAAEFTGTSA